MIKFCLLRIMPVLVALASCIGVASAQTRGDVQPRPADYDVGIRKSGPATPPTIGQTATFTLNPFNTGPGTVNSGGVVVTDTLPASFTAPVAANGMGAGWNCTVAGLVVTCTYNGPAVGPHRQFPGITITAVVAHEGRYENCAGIVARVRRDGPRDAAGVAAIRDVNPRDNRDCARGDIKPGGGGEGYDVGIRKSGEEGKLEPGQTGTFTLHPFNNGPSPVGSATGVTVTDTLPANFTPPVAAAGASPGWTCAVSGLVVTCVYSGAAVAAHQPLPEIRITAVAGHGGSYRNCAWIAMNRRILMATDKPIRDTNLRDNSDCVDGEVVGDGGGQEYDVGINKTGPNGPVMVGQTATFTLNASNIGPAPVNAGTGATVTDTLPVNFTAPISATSNSAGWSCSVAGRVVTCVWTGAAVGPNENFPAITITAVAGSEGAYSNCVSIALLPKGGPRDAATPGGRVIKDVNPRDNRDCVDGRVVAGRKSYNLNIRKLGGGTVAAGSPITFSFDVFNLGPDAVAGITVVDTLPAGLTNIVAPTGSPWNCTLSGNVLTCAYNGGPVALNLHFPAVSIQATAQDPGSFSNCARVAIDGASDSDLQDNRDCRAYEVTGGIGTVTIIKDAAPDDPQDFFFLFGTSGGSFVLDDDGVNFNPYPNQTTLAGLAAGPWTFTENAVNGWDLTAIACVPSTGTTPDIANRNVTVNVTNGASITCRFTNAKQPPPGTATLTIIKDAAPDDAQDFHFTVAGPGLSDFSLDDDPSDGQLPNSITFTGLATGVPFTVTEDGISGWTVPSLQCIPDIIGTSTTFTDQLNRTMTVSMAPGVHMTCTFQNVK